MLLVESNIFIYAILSEHKKLLNWLVKQHFAVAETTLVEVLGFHRLPAEDAQSLEHLFNIATILPMSRAIVDQAIALRQQRKMSLGDSLIAATALDHGLSLVTRNTSDFEWIEGLVFEDVSHFFEN
jgi:predicted nucleic acid-binding protein